jgi:putative aldouronate transport system permease protein
MQISRHEVSPISVFSRGKAFLKKIAAQKFLLAMCLPFVVWLIIFRYIPLWGWTMSFQNYKPGVGFFTQQWVGLKYFIMLFQDKYFYVVMRNTVAMSLLQLVFGFTLPIVLAILLNEIRKTAFKRTVQTISYLPHFVSWVVVASLFGRILGLDNGVVNSILIKLHIIDNPIQFMGKPELFWWIVTFADIWKEIGWNSILFLAAITAISPELYEAAMVDGAGRFKRIWHVTLPGILPVVMVILIMNVGNLINIGFEKQFLLRNSLTLNNANVLEIYILEQGIGANRYGFGTAAGMFKSVVSIILLFLVNGLSIKLTGIGIITKRGGTAR